MADPQLGATWADKVYFADRVISRLLPLLESRGLELPQTPRKPDVRMVVNNTTGNDLVFFNPGQHSDMPETIPGKGEKTAAMIMPAGDTLQARHENARIIAQRHNLMQNGLTETFVRKALPQLAAQGLVKEAYGPAPFDRQMTDLQPLNWPVGEGQSVELDPVKGTMAGFGPRALKSEAVFKLEIPMYLKGTDTTAEKFLAGSYAAFSRNRETGALESKPIAPSEAADYYGAYFNDIPVVEIHPDSETLIKRVDLKNGTVIQTDPPKGYAASASPSPRPGGATGAGVKPN